MGTNAAQANSFGFQRATCELLQGHGSSGDARKLACWPLEPKWVRPGKHALVVQGSAPLPSHVLIEWFLDKSRFGLTGSMRAAVPVLGLMASHPDQWPGKES